MTSKVVLVSCTNVGRHIINFFLNKKKFKGIELSGVVNLNRENSINKSNYDSYYDLKINYGINVHYVNNINSKSVFNWIKKINPTLIIQSGWSQKFSDKILKLPKFGCIGQHPAPLPIGRGAACVNWAIILGYKKWGDTFFIMDKDYDNGDVVGQEKFLISKNDDVKTVYDKICFTSKKIFSENISEWVKGNFKKKKQNLKHVTYFKKRRPKDGKINIFKEDNLTVYNKIRALTKPYPGAYINYKNKKIFIWKSKLLSYSTFKNFKNNKRLFLYKKKLILKLGVNKNSFLQIKRMQINNSPEFDGCDYYKYSKI